MSSRVLGSRLRAGRWPRVASLVLVILAGVALSGCLKRSGQPDLPYVRPAYTVPEVDEGRVRIVSRMEEMEAELRNLRGMIERLQGSAQDEVAIRNLEERVSFIERQLGIEAPPPSKRDMPPPSRVPPPAPQIGRRETQPSAPPPLNNPNVPSDRQRVEIHNAPIPADEKAYREAYLLVRRGSLKEATPLLEAFIKNYPKSPLASDAVYWLGETLYGQGRYDEAVLQFDRVIKEYKGSKKELSAYLKQGEAFAKMGDAKSARIIFQQLINEYPHTAQARIAKAKLKALSQ
jgi:tol-pal system protein YbgF